MTVLRDPSLPHQPILKCDHDSGVVRLSCNCRQDIGPAPDYEAVLTLYNNPKNHSKAFSLSADILGTKHPVYGPGIRRMAVRAQEHADRLAQARLS